MQNTFKYTGIFGILTVLLCVCLVANISLGSVSIPYKTVLQLLTGQDIPQENWKYIVLDYRIPKAITAMATGIGLSVSGLLMQTLFKNPLADPYVLGLSAGSSLGVSLVILGAGFLPLAVVPLFTGAFGIVLASTLGSVLVLLLILVAAQWMKDTLSILIIGLMFGSFTSSFVGILSYFSTAEQLKRFSFWSMGNVGNLDFQSICILCAVVFLGLLLSFLSIKPLNTLLLGEHYAHSLGMNYKRVRFVLILATSLLSGAVTAFVGPIGFIGLAIPHIVKLIFRSSNHFPLFFGCILLGATALLICDTLSQAPGLDTTFPINAITSMVGAPVVIWLLLRRNK